MGRRGRAGRSAPDRGCRFFVGEVHGYQKQGAAYGYTRKLGYHPLLATRADNGEVLHIRLRKGSANILPSNAPNLVTQRCPFSTK